MLEVVPHNSLNIVKMAIKFSLALEKMNFQTRACRRESSQIHRFKQYNTGFQKLSGSDNWDFTLDGGKNSLMQNY